MSLKDVTTTKCDEYFASHFFDWATNTRPPNNIGLCSCRIASNTFSSVVDTVIDDEAFKLNARVTATLRTREEKENRQHLLLSQELTREELDGGELWECVHLVQGGGRVRVVAAANVSPKYHALDTC